MKLWESKYYNQLKILETTLNIIKLYEQKWNNLKSSKYKIKCKWTKEKKKIKYFDLKFDIPFCIVKSSPIIPNGFGPALIKADYGPLKCIFLST